MTTLALDLPADLLTSTGHSSNQLCALAREALLVRLYDRSGVAMAVSVRGIVPHWEAWVVRCARCITRRVCLSQNLAVAGQTRWA